MTHNKKVIVHIITLLELGGAQQNTIYTVTHLNRETFQPILITGKGAILDAEVPGLDGIPVYFISWLKRTINPLYDIVAFFKIFIQLKKIKPDIVHTHSSKAGILGRWASFCARVPVIIHTYHGFGFHEYQNKFIHCVYVLLEKCTAYITTRIICVSSDNIAYALKKKIGDQLKYTLIRSGISLQEYRSNARSLDNVRKEFSLQPSDRIITMIACFKPQKNCIDFVRLAACLSKNAHMPPLKFILIGDGEQRPGIEKEIEKNGLRSVFYMPGWRRDVRYILSVTDIFVLTSLWEGLPRAAVEALVSGVPICAYAVDGLKEIVKHAVNGYLFEPFNIAAMAEKISEMLHDEELYKKLSHNASQSIGSEFDIDFMVREQEELYR